MTVLALDRVTKRFERTLAVDGLSFAVNEGEVFGFLGGNGTAGSPRQSRTATHMAPARI